MSFYAACELYKLKNLYDKKIQELFLSKVVFFHQLFASY